MPKKFGKIANFTEIIVLTRFAVISNIYYSLWVTGITLIVKENMLNGLLEMVLVILFLLTVGKHGEFNFLIQLNLNTAFSLRTEYTF